MNFHDVSAISLVGLLTGGAFLLLALVSTFSKVTLSVLNPLLGRQIGQSDHPRTFVSLVIVYWLIGVAGMVVGIVGLLASI